MRAVLLAAGLGTRLRPLTDTVPKCLVPIKGKPLLDIWIESLLEAGVERILVNLHYKHELVEDHIAKSVYREQVETVFEQELLGTAGTLVTNRDFFQGEDGIFIHADNYSEADLSQLIELHGQRPKSCLMTMLAFRTDTPQTCGILELDAQNILQKMYEKSPENHGNLANAALYILSSELVASVTTEHDFSTQVIPKLLKRIYVVETDKIYIDIGTPESYQRAQEIANVD